MARFGLKIRRSSEMVSGGFWYFALACCLSMIFSENRCPLFGIMLQHKHSFFASWLWGWWSRELNP